MQPGRARRKRSAISAPSRRPGALREMVETIARSKSGARLNLAGEFPEGVLKSEVRKTPGWAKVNELGFLSRPELRAVLDRSMAGVVTLHPTPAYIHALPVKLFEYMAAGLPVIASDFPLWREIVVGNGCGICVDPLNSASIAGSIDRLLAEPGEAKRWARTGVAQFRNDTIGVLRNSRSSASMRSLRPRRDVALSLRRLNRIEIG